MKNKLLLLLALVAMPAWAGGVDIQFKGKAKDVKSAVEQMQKDKSFQDAACTVSKNKVHCDQAAGALLEYLDANTALRWTISSSAKMPMKSTATCPVGCLLMHCPPPGGSVVCCNTKTYAPC